MPGRLSISLTLLRTQSDERLLELAREGHERAFEAIVDRYRRPLLGACRRVVGEARAEDAVQQTLVAAWTAIGRGDEIRDLRAWLYRIAHNTSLNLLRVRGFDFDELADSLRAGGAGPEEEAERRAVMRETLASLAALPDRQREALLRTAVEGRTQEEVAQDLGLSSGAVRQLVHRARVTLRAAATALTPMPLVSWVATAGTPPAITEIAAGGATVGAGSIAAKLGVAAVVAGGIVGTPVVVHEVRQDRAQERAARTAEPVRARDASAGAAGTRAAAPGATATPGGEDRPARSERGDDDPREGARRRDRGRSQGQGRGRGRGRGRGPGSDDDPRGQSGGDRRGGEGVPGLNGRDDRSGSGPSGSSGSGRSGGDDDRSGGGGDDRSGSGRSGSGRSGSDDREDDDRSGSGGSGTSGGGDDSSGSGGSGTSGGGDDSSGSGGSGTSGGGDDSSGSGTSGSGSSGGGDDSSGSGTSGSGTSGGGDDSSGSGT
ncbi:MAG TPA: sigma-70 family RNA polymerase sigma factor, partial [Solirubrobacteraceae bacterium]